MNTTEKDAKILHDIMDNNDDASTAITDFVTDSATANYIQGVMGMTTVALGCAIAGVLANYVQNKIGEIYLKHMAKIGLLK